jgi:xylulose-5-phosphate/fructose-6-phosphate phosphoketolase
LSVTDHCLRSHNYINVIVAGKQPQLQWLDMESAMKHCADGIGIWQWAGNEQEGQEADIVMTCAGDVPTLEMIAAVQLLREHLPELKVRVINVVDIMTLLPETVHPHGLSDKAFDLLFTTNKPVVVAFHGYPSLIHRLTYKRTNHENFHVRGYIGEGTTTTPFDMVVMNGLDRFSLVIQAIERLPQTGTKGAHVKQIMKNKLLDHKTYIEFYGEDMPEIKNWKWEGSK